MGRVALESGNPKDRELPPDLLFPGFGNQLIRSLAARSEFVRAQVEMQGDSQCAQLPPDLGSAWLESLMLSYQDIWELDDSKFVQFIKVRNSRDAHET